MKKLGFSLFLFCLWLPGQVAEVVAFEAETGTGNWLRNGDFRHGLHGWTVRFPEAGETVYSRNHEWIEVSDNPLGTGRVIRFTLSRAVAATEGVKAATPLMPVEAGVSYQFGADILSLGPSAKIILEGYVEDAERTAAGADQIPGYRRIYRAVIHPKGVSGREWTTHRRIIAPPVRYQPTHVLFKLYAYWPEGVIYFDNAEFRRVE